MRTLLFFPFLLLPVISFSQEHWEDEFWRKETRDRYVKTGTMAGLYTTFYPNGKIKWQGRCLENGTPDSIWVYYDEEGHKYWEGSYNGDFVEYKEYYTLRGDTDWQNGNDADPYYRDTTLIGHYKNGLKDGEWKQYDNRGKYVFKIGHFRNGEPTGIWQEFREETVVTRVAKYAEYDYTTQVRTNYKLDSIDGTLHIDSLRYEKQFGLDRDYVDAANDGSTFNFCPIAIVHVSNLSSVNDFYLQKGYSILESQLRSVGVEWSGTAERVYYVYNIAWTPAVSAQLNDSIRLRLSGWNTNFQLGGDLIGSDVVDLCPAGGLGYQQLRLKTLKLYNQDTTAYSFGEGDYRVYKRYAFVPNASLTLRVNMGNASLSICGGYQYDLSSRLWRYNGKYLKNGPHTDLSCPFVSVAFGIHIPDF